MKATTVRFDEHTLERLDKLAAAMDRSRAWVIKEAVAHFLDYESWFAQQVEEGLEDVKRGSLASEQTVNDIFSKWNPDVG